MVRAPPEIWRFIACYVLSVGIAGGTTGAHTVDGEDAARWRFLVEREKAGTRLDRPFFIYLFPILSVPEMT